MNQEPKYIIERWPHGWLLCAAPGNTGIPMDALKECQTMFPKNSVLSAGIVHHYNVCGHPHKVIMAIASQKEFILWGREITDGMVNLDPYQRWWRGLHVGKSSAAIFAVFTTGYLSAYAEDYARSATPQDSDDFGRCAKLINIFPEWKPRLNEVSEAYPNTKWPAIISRWDELVSANPERQTEILRSL